MTGEDLVAAAIRDGPHYDAFINALYLKLLRKSLEFLLGIGVESNVRCKERTQLVYRQLTKD